MDLVRNLQQRSLGHSVAVMDKCCLCRRALGDELSMKKCKKLYGESAKKEWRVLELVCTKDHQTGLDGFVETANQDALLCHGCILELCQIDRLRAELENVSSAVSSKLLNSHSNTTQHIPAAAQLLRKRSAPEEEPCSSRSVADSNELPGNTPVAHNSVMSSPPVEVSIIILQADYYVDIILLGQGRQNRYGQYGRGHTTFSGEDQPCELGCL